MSDQSAAVRRAGAELRIGGIHDDDVEGALDASVGHEADAQLDEVANDDLGRDAPARPGGAGFAVGHGCPELRGNAGIDFNGRDFDRDVRSVRQHAIDQGRRERPDAGPRVEHPQDSRGRQMWHARDQLGGTPGGEELAEPGLCSGFEFGKRHDAARLGP